MLLQCKKIVYTWGVSKEHKLGGKLAKQEEWKYSKYMTAVKKIPLLCRKITT